MSVLQRAKEHFGTLINAELSEIEVPEWPDDDGKPTIIYFSPALSLDDHSKIYQAKEESIGKSLALTLILRAKDAEGKRMFREIEMKEIMRFVDPDVVARIVGEMVIVPDEDDLKKK